MNKTFYALIAIIGVMAVAGLFLPRLEFPMGGTTHFSGPLDSEAGYYTNGTNTINSEAQFITAFNGTTIAASGAATLSSTLTVSGETQTATVIRGGATTTGSTGTSTTLTPAQVCDNAIIELAMNGTSGDATITLPSGTNLYSDCLGSGGKNKIEILFRNVADGLATSASNTYVVAGTDMDLLTASTSAGLSKIAAGEDFILSLFRARASTVVGVIERLVDAD